MIFMRLQRARIIYIFFAYLFFIYGCSANPYIIRGAKNFYKDYPTFSHGDVINCVIEIPAGEKEKWEVNPLTGNLECDFKKGKPRTIKYAVSYPFNYGMIPQTLAAKERGGDGDPLDIVIFGKRIKRANIVQVKVLGILHIIDNGEVDDKILAIPVDDNVFLNIETLKEFEYEFPGALEIVKIWFSNYKLNKTVVLVKDFSEKEEALSFIKAARQDYLKYLK